MKQIHISATLSLISLIFISYLPSSCNGLRCYYCNSETDKRCGDPFNNTVIPAIRHDECTPTYYAGSTMGTKYVCRKIKHRLNDEVTVSRMCAPEGDRENDPCSPNALSSYIKVEFCGTCDTELCNSAPSIATITASFLGPLTLLASKLNLI